MTLKPEYNGDITKAPGYFLAVAMNLETDEFLGFYAMCDDGTYVRGAGNWITATGPSLSKLHGARLVEMKQSFIHAFDKLDSEGEKPDLERIKIGSTTGRPASWDSQHK